VTTTGGRGDLDLSAPDLRTPDGDDIVVIPDAQSPRSRGRMRALLVGAIVLVLAGAAITVALVSRDGDDSNRVSSIAKRETPTTAKRVATKPTAKTPVKPRGSVPPPTAVTIPNAASPTTVGAPVVITPPPPPPTPEYPPSVLTWQTTPAELTIKAGGNASVSLTVLNPTDGNVTLGQPLSCAPTLTHESGGAPIGNGVCVQMAQVVSPLQTLTQQYTIYATKTGDASGAPLGIGRYMVRFENLHSIWLTVTAN
jgi:hypothetical protein